MRCPASHLASTLRVELFCCCSNFPRRRLLLVVLSTRPGDAPSSPVMEPDDNPFRRPTGQASINSTSNPTPLPAVAADAVDGTGQRQCARLAESNATAQRSIAVGADVLGSLETQRAQLIATQGTLAQQQSDLNRAGPRRNQGLYGRPARPNRLIGRGWPKPGAA